MRNDVEWCLIKFGLNISNQAWDNWVS